MRILPASSPLTILGLVGLSSIALILIFPWYDLSFLAWVALIPFFLALQGRGYFGAFALSFVMGISMAMGVVYWINMPAGVAWVDFVLMAGYFGGAFWGLFGLVFTILSQRTSIPAYLTAPTIWVTMEYLRSNFFFLEDPWALLGHSQSQHLVLIQMSTFTGVYGISFLIVMVNVALYECFSRKWEAWRSALLSLSVLAVVLGYGWTVLSTPLNAPTVPVTVIQGNIPQDMKWDEAFRTQMLSQQVSLTKQATQLGSTSLIVWPETSVPGDPQKDMNLHQQLSQLANASKAHLLVGNAERAKFSEEDLANNNRFNDATLFLANTSLVRKYHKMKLVPFGEFLPHKDTLPWPARFFTEAGNFLPGTDYTVFALPGINGSGPMRFSALICWETIFPDHVRQFVQRGAQFLVNMTNESWFGVTSAPYQFFAINIFRAVENRRALVRSTNTGISGFIDPYGRILGQVKQGGNPLFVEGYLTMEVPLQTTLTFYTQHGDVFAQGTLVLSVLFLILAIIRPPHRVPSGFVL